ncbi:hypothetical protein BH18CHL1_BH18CHL1_07250 [soil metagenome]
MPDATFRGDPYRVLGVAHDASDATIKRRWRELAREHHPDRAARDPAETERLTARMALINAAYDLLRDPLRRARYDASPQARRTRADGHGGTSARPGAGNGAGERRARPYGPPPPPPTTPITARYDTSRTFHGRNTTTSSGQTSLAGHPPLDRRLGRREAELRASTPTGPVRRRPSGRPPTPPSLDEARSTVLAFGRFHGHTLAEVAAMEPTYIDWISQTITRDRDLVQSARVVQSDMDERGVERIIRGARPGFGNASGSGARAEGAGAAAAR